MWGIRRIKKEIKSQIKYPVSFTIIVSRRTIYNYQHQLINNHIKSLLGKYAEGKHNTLKANIESQKLVEFSHTKSKVVYFYE